VRRVVVDVSVDATVEMIQVGYGHSLWAGRDVGVLVVVRYVGVLVHVAHVKVGMGNTLEINMNVPMKHRRDVCMSVGVRNFGCIVVHVAVPRRRQLSVNGVNRLIEVRIVVRDVRVSVAVDARGGVVMAVRVRRTAPVPAGRENGGNNRLWFWVVLIRRHH